LLRVEQLEGRVALSPATPVPPPDLGAGLSSGLSDGSGWFLEVRKAHVRGSKWHWTGPFADPAKAKAKLRHHGMAVRGQRFLRSDDPALVALLDGLPPLPSDPGSIDLGVPGPGSGPGSGPTQYLQGYNVQGLHPVLGWISLSPPEIFTDAYSAYQDVLNRDAIFYPIVYRYVLVSLPANQWHVVGNRIVPNF
jgi:hypothetical protein